MQYICVYLRSIVNKLNNSIHILFRCRHRRQGDQQRKDLHRSGVAPQRKVFWEGRPLRRQLLLSSQNDGTQEKRLRSSGQRVEVSLKLKAPSMLF